MVRVELNIAFGVFWTLTILERFGTDEVCVTDTPTGRSGEASLKTSNPVHFADFVAMGGTLLPPA